MSFPDYTDGFREYWIAAADGGRKQQILNAAADPLHRWLVADAPSLVEEPVDLDPSHLQQKPDDVLAAAREGFAAAVTDLDLPDLADPNFGYEVLPIHLTAVDRVDGIDTTLTNPIDDANRLVTVQRATVTDDVAPAHERAIVTYRCPAGHETTIESPLLRPWNIEACGRPECTNAVVPDDTRTRVRPTARFTVDTPVGPLDCVATGRYAAVPDDNERLGAASALHLTAIPRLVTDETGSLDPTLVVLSADATAP